MELRVVERYTAAPAHFHSGATADGVELARMQADVAPLLPGQRAAIPAGRRIGIGMILTLAGVTFPEYGAYSLVITWDGTEVREPIRLFVQPLVAAPPRP